MAVKEILSDSLKSFAAGARQKCHDQPRHKIIQITGHANECSLDDYDEVDEGERRTLSDIIGGDNKMFRNTAELEFLVSSSYVAVHPSSVSPLSSAAALAQTSFPLPTRQTSPLPSEMPVSRSVNDPAVQHFNNCTVNSLKLWIVTNDFFGFERDIF